MGFAKCHDLFDKSDLAILSLENSMKKAEDQHPETVKLISKELIAIYKKLAEKYEVEAKDFDENVQAALGYYEKCLVVCDRAGQIEL
jgi:molecular chaperone GrpE (heat shock protein)